MACRYRVSALGVQGLFPSPLCSRCLCGECPLTDTHGEFDTVAETAQVYEAEMMALRLREAGIEAQVLDQSYRQEPLPSVRSFALVRVLVPSARAEEARRLLAEQVPLPEDAESGDTNEMAEGERNTK